MATVRALLFPFIKNLIEAHCIPFTEKHYFTYLKMNFARIFIVNKPKSMEEFYHGKGQGGTW